MTVALTVQTGFRPGELIVASALSRERTPLFLAPSERSFRFTVQTFENVPTLVRTFTDGTHEPMMSFERETAAHEALEALQSALMATHATGDERPAEERGDLRPAAGGAWHERLSPKGWVVVVAGGLLLMTLILNALHRPAPPPPTAPEAPAASAWTPPDLGASEALAAPTATDVAAPAPAVTPTSAGDAFVQQASGR